MFRILCAECQFLVEEKLNVLLKPLEENERRLILIDAILSAINIDTESEMKELIQTVVDSGVVKENLDDTDPNLVYKVRQKFSQILHKDEKFYRESDKVRLFLIFLNWWSRAFLSVVNEFKLTYKVQSKILDSILPLWKTQL